MSVPAEQSVMAPCDHVVPGEHVYDGIMYPGLFPAHVLERIQSFEYRDEDVIIATYPKSGTTWMGEILKGLLKTAIPDQEKITDLPYMEMDLSSFVGVGPFIDMMGSMPSPRAMKTHLEVKFYKKALEHKKTKFIVVMRNIKDALVSYYHFYRSNQGLGQMKGSFEDFLNLYKRRKLQDWFDWNLEWWKYKEHPNVIFVTYEDMKTDIKQEVRRVVNFLGLSFSDDAIADVCNHGSFGAMSSRMAKDELLNRIVDPKISPFMRKGEIGDWKNHFNEADNQYIDDLLKKRVEGAGLVFKYE